MWPMESFRIWVRFVFGCLSFIVRFFGQFLFHQLLWLLGAVKSSIVSSAPVGKTLHSCEVRGRSGHTYCVCNTSSSCTPLQTRPLMPGQVNVYVSTQGGDRFAFSRLPLESSSSNFSVDDDCSTNRSCLFSRNPPVVSVLVDESRQLQRIEGFGGAMTDAAAENILSLPQSLQKQVIQDYFGPDGLEYSIVRMTIGGSDFSSRQYTLDDHPDDFDLEHFALPKEDIEWKIPLLQQALDLNKDIKFLGSAWSPPAWMKTNGKLNGKGQLIGEPGGKYYKTYANYLVRYFEEYRKRNITFWGMTTQNEPWDGFVPGFPFNCLGLTAEQIRDFIKLDLGPALNQSEFTTDRFRLFIVDDQRLYLPSWTRRIMADPDAAKYVYGAAFHWYMNFLVPASYLDQVHREYPDLVLLSTEACTGSTVVPLPFHKHVDLGNWCRAQDYALDIVEDLNHWTAGWIDWNLALDLQGGPNWSKNFVDAPIIVNATAAEYYRQPSFYILAHFSKFLAPGSVRLAHTQKTSSWIDLLRVNVHTVVLRNTQGQNVMIAVNAKDSPVDLHVHAQSNTRFYMQMAPKSIATFVWE